MTSSGQFTVMGMSDETKESRPRGKREKNHVNLTMEQEQQQQPSE
jgi:hypothetical protein